MIGVHVTRHALERAKERIPGCTTDEEARALLSSEIIRRALIFGAMFVRLGTGQRIALRDGAVVTVLPAENYRKHIGRVGKGRYG